VKATRLASAAVLALVIATGVVYGQGRTTETTARIARGQRVDVRVLAGSVKASRSEDADVHVSAVSSDPSVKVQVEETSRGVRVCTAIDGGGCDGSRDRRSTGDRELGRVDVVVRVPEGVSFSSSLVAGSIDVEGLTAGINLSTVSGDATIVLPAWADADVSANTVSGRIDSEFRIEVSQRDSPRPFLSSGGGRSFGPVALRGTIGSGGQEVRAATVSGDIRLRQQ
jgi:hypothetical protein